MPTDSNELRWVLSFYSTVLFEQGSECDRLHSCLWILTVCHEECSPTTFLNLISGDLSFFLAREIRILASWVAMKSMLDFPFIFVMSDRKKLRCCIFMCTACRKGFDKNSLRITILKDCQEDTFVFIVCFVWWKRLSGVCSWKCSHVSCMY